ncbi:MAG: DUF4407 domain-containing protein [Mycobacterium sp.]|uniref:DUF4407 domain-containing protein n=1 Tax=Mycobacterium sp. TaxID=1785 RepID=UPI001EC85102|nr:DUF4407 domain-containing protein [Mycobacterium sp.]MBW0019161.1 DUF4407 domain-containing protein [Mycobacterium sp.]
MCAQVATEQRSAGSRIEGLLTWLGGGHWRELGERHERSTHAVAGAVVLLGALLAGLVASLAVHDAVRWPLWALLALTVVFGLLVGAVTRGTASGSAQGRPGLLGTVGRASVAIAIGVVVGELAAVAAFSGAIDHRLDQRALENADSAPGVAQASTSLTQAQSARAALDTAVDQARGHLDNALVVARCEYNPTPPCPQTRITGIPGPGPETRTANELLADAQRELDNALATRDRQSPELDADVARDQQALAAARRAVVADADRGLGARWVALNDLTLASAGALLLRVLMTAFFALLYLLPLILRRWRGETTHDRHAAARADRDRADLVRERADFEADTAIAIKRAEVRQAAEIMWAEHQLTQTRLAIEAQAEIDREQQRRRVSEALEAPVRASVQRGFEPVRKLGEEDMYLPIAAEAEAASRAVAELPSAAEHPRAEVAENLPAPAEKGGDVAERAERGAPLIPSISDATGAARAAARWIRPLVPPIVARAIDNTTQPLRTARQVFEEVEEIAFSFKRTRKVTVNSESSEGSDQPPGADPRVSHAEAPVSPTRIESMRDYGRHAGTTERLDATAEYAPLPGAGANDIDALEPTEHGAHRELVRRDGPAELRSPEEPRQLPPGR